MQTVDLCAPKRKWRVVVLETGKRHCAPRQFIKDCDSKQEAFTLADTHNLGVDPRLAYHVFDSLGRCWRGPGELIPLIKTILRIEKHAA